MKKGVGRCILMILLILTLPFYSSFAFAQGGSSFQGLITYVKIYGSDGIHRVIDAGDTNVYIDVLIAESSVSPDLVKFHNVSFESCVPGDGGSLCTLSLVLPLQEGMEQYVISYKGVTQSQSYVIDGSAPTVTDFDVNRTSSNQIIAHIVANDEILDLGHCAGIAGVEISDDPNFLNIVASKAYNITGINQCELDDTIVLEAPTSSGDYAYYARVFDRLGHLQLAQTSSTISVDVDAPEFVDARLTLNDVPVSSVTVGSASYTLEVDLSENVELDEVYADITNFGGGANTPSNCEEEGTVYRCRWSVIPPVTAQTTGFSGTIHATDTAGNELDEPFTVPVSVDSDEPVIGTITTENGNYFGATDNTLIVEVTDTGVGFDESEVLADLRQISPAYGIGEAADECDANESKCYWYNLDASGPEGTKTVVINARDRFGQLATKSKDFDVDITAPVITNITQSALAPSAGIAEPLRFYVRGTEANGIRYAVADVSLISTLSDPVNGTCAMSGTNFICEFEVTDIVTSHVQGNVDFTVYDLAGNPSSDTHSVFVYDSDLTTTPNEVAITVGAVTPQKLDRKIAVNIPLKVFVPLHFDYSDTVEVIDKAAQCTGLDTVLYAGTNSQNPYIIGKEMDDSLLVFEIMLDEATSKLESIEFNCTMYSLVARGTTVFLNPEIDNIIASIDLYDIPIGDPGNNVLRKLRDIEKRVNTDFFDYVTKIEGWLEALRKICKVGQEISRIYTVVQDMKPIVYTAAMIMEWAYTGAGEEVWQLFLTGDCYLRVLKETLWPNDTDYYYTKKSYEDAAKARGVKPEKFEFTDALFGGKSLGKEDGEIGGFVRRVCAFVLCSQCNKGFSITGIQSIPKALDKPLAKALQPGAPAPSELKSEDETRMEARQAQPTEEVAPAPPEKKPAKEKSSGLFGGLLGSLGLGGAVLDITGAQTAQPTQSQVGQIDVSIFKEINLETRLNPMDNYIVAVDCLCLPGVVHNLNKYRQLQCIHARCITDMAKGGFSTAACDIAHAENECVFFWGPVMQLIPGFMLAKQIATISRDLIKELPGRLMTASRDALCTNFDNQVKMQQEAYVGGKRVTSFNSATSIEQCTESNSVDAKLLNVEKNAWVLACGVFDAAMLAWSWEEFVENTVKFDVDFTDMTDSKNDQCKDAFDDYEKWEQEAREAAAGGGGGGTTTTTVPTGAGNLTTVTGQTP
ncbi:hypothetical protein KY335_00880 [Candidatus Woesearchaeota archaeon]|nr:hypothetical protein [Candidatus Woesearchaeota archaeon]